MNCAPAILFLQQNLGKVEKQRVNQEQDFLEPLFWHLLLQTLGPNLAFFNQINKIWHCNSSQT